MQSPVAATRNHHLPKPHSVHQERSEDSTCESQMDPSILMCEAAWRETSGDAEEMDLGSDSGHFLT